MSKIQSGLGNMEFKSTDQTLFKVSDETGTAREERQAPSQNPLGRQISPEEVNKFRNSFNSNPNMEHSKKRIEMLAGIARGTAEVDISGIKFSLRTLKGKEIRHLLSVTSRAQMDIKLGKSDAFEDLLDIRTISLAHSLYAIDGMDINVVLDISGADDREAFQYKMDYLNELDETLLKVLYDKYQEMSKTNNEKFGIKSEADAKEVSKEMKKSSSGA